MDVLSLLREIDKPNSCEAVRFCVAVPASFRTIRHIDSPSTLRDKKYYLKFPELVFCFNVEADYGKNYEMRCENTNISESIFNRIAITLQVFYKKEDKLYSTYLPNQFQRHSFCLGDISYDRTKSNIKREIVNCINYFFLKPFTYDFRIDILKVPGVCPVLGGPSCPSMLFQYWEMNSKKDDFEIFNCSLIKTSPLSRICFIDGNFTHFRSTELTPSYVKKIPYLKDLQAN